MIVHSEIFFVEVEMDHFPVKCWLRPDVTIVVFRPVEDE